MNSVDTSGVAHGKPLRNIGCVFLCHRLREKIKPKKKKRKENKAVTAPPTKSGVLKGNCVNCTRQHLFKRKRMKGFVFFVTPEGARDEMWEIPWSDVIRQK